MKCIGAVIMTASLFAADIPRPAPAMVFPTTDGGSVDTAKLKGKAVCLAFILTTCPHCQSTSAVLQRIQNDMAPLGVQVAAVATNPMAHMLIPDFVKNFGVRFPVAYTDEAHAHEFLQHPTMQIMYYPQLVFIDRSGTIKKQAGGNDPLFKGNQDTNIRAEMEKLLKPATTPVSSRKVR